MENEKSQGLKRFLPWMFIALGIVFVSLGAEGLYANSNEDKDPTFKEELSYGNKSTYFTKKGWSGGLSEITQSRQRDPWRHSTWSERVSHFISELRKGNAKVFLYADYALLDGYSNPHTHKSVHGYPTHEGEIESQGVLWTLKKEAEGKKSSIVEVLTEGEPKIRANVIRAALSGLFNKDPRVRLVAINILRRLGPDGMMEKKVRRALLLETVATEFTKWRPKDLDIPTIESPRLGYGAVAWKNESDPYLMSERMIGYHPEMSMQEFLDGNGKGRYLTEGLYKKGERNDYPIFLYRRNLMNDAELSKDQVWTKASLLRYGPNQQSSGYENDYNLSIKRISSKNVYLSIDYRNPKTNVSNETLYYAYHNPWEELKKLHLFVERAIWTNKITKDQMSMVGIGKDTFRALADQIDGESLENVPMKSPSFKIFSEKQIKAIIVGMLKNRVVSTRESCVRFLKRFYQNYSGIKPETRKSIKLALKEARRRELIVDTVRGRHLQAELLVFKKPSSHSSIKEESVQLKAVPDVNPVQIEETIEVQSEDTTEMDKSKFAEPDLESNVKE